MRILATILALPIALFAISDSGAMKIKRVQRQAETHTTKSKVTEFDADQSLKTQSNNGDEKAFADLRGSFNKGLAHLSNGFPNTAAFSSLIEALGSSSNTDFFNIQIGQGDFRLVSPQSSFAFTLAGNDGWVYSMPPAPSFTSAETAAEMVELYWTAIVRNVNFNEYDMDGDVASAIADLNTLTDFTGPKVGGVVTDGTFLRGSTPGDLIGPYISQFLYLPIPFGAITITPDLSSSSSADDFNTTFADWFQVITGGTPAGAITPTAAPFIRNARDLAEYVHNDSPGQSALGALLILNSFGTDALDPANPYRSNPTQDGFVTFGLAQFQALLRNAVQAGLKAAWYQKWQVHRRLRPEEYGFYVDAQKNGANLGINSQLIDSPALTDIFGTFGSYFLPVAYPEGSPVHPSYPAGHATLMGAAVTILKALFDETFEIPSPVEPNGANDTLIPFGGTLTVGNELNKLAANISLGRDHAGVHYRSDGIEGMLLGEKVAIDILNNESFLFNEAFPDGYTLTKFDGTKIKVGKKR